MTSSEEETRAWLADRRKLLGASDIAAVLGISPWATAFSVYMDKTACVQQDESQKMSWGKLQETLIAQVYSDIHRVKLIVPSPKLTVHPELPWIGASIDRITASGKIVELKTAEDRKGWGEEYTDQIPAYYHVQVTQQMAVGRASGIAPCDEADVAVLLAGCDYRTYTVPWKESVWLDIKAAAFDFWHNNVLKGEAPPLDYAHPVNQRIIFAVEGFTEDVDVTFTDKENEWVQKYLECKQWEAHYKALKLEAKARVLVAMGEAANGYCKAGKVQRRKIRRAGYTVKETTYIRMDVKSMED